VFGCYVLAERCSIDCNFWAHQDHCTVLLVKDIDSIIGSCGENSMGVFDTVSLLWRTDANLWGMRQLRLHWRIGNRLGGYGFEKGKRVVNCDMKYRVRSK